MPVRFVSVPWDCQPLEAGVIAEPYRRGLLLVADADQRVPVFAALGRNRAIAGVRGAGKSGAGWATDASNYVRGANDAGSDTALFEIPAGGSWTVQFVVENVGGSGTNPGFFRNNSAGTGTTFLLQDGTTRRAWVRINSTDILRPSTGAQWTTGQKLNLIVRCQNATRVEAWWDGMLQHSATHSTSQEALTGADSIYALYSHQQGGSGAQTTTGSPVASRAWARYLDDQEMHALARDELALYEPRRIWFFGSVGAGTALPVFVHHYRQQGIM